MADCYIKGFYWSPIGLFKYQKQAYYDTRRNEKGWFQVLVLSVGGFAWINISSKDICQPTDFTGVDTLSFEDMVRIHNKAFETA